MIIKRCDNCIHAVEIKNTMQIGQTMLQCRARPPTPMVMPDAQGRAVLTAQWPLVAPDAWCGLFTASTDDTGTQTQ